MKLFVSVPISKVLIYFFSKIFQISSHAYAGAGLNGFHVSYYENQIIFIPNGHFEYIPAWAEFYPAALDGSNPQ